MKLRHNPASLYVRKVMIVAHELGLAGKIELLSMQATKPPAG